MTTLKRIVLILAAALLVVGATLAWTQLSPASSTSAERQPPASFTSGSSLEMPAGLRSGGEHEAGGLSAAGEVAKSVLIVGALTVAAAGVSRLWDWVRAGNRRAPPRAA